MGWLIGQVRSCAPSGTGVKWDRCEVGQVSGGKGVKWDRCQEGQVSSWAVVKWDRCQVGQVSSEKLCAKWDCNVVATRVLCDSYVISL